MALPKIVVLDGYTLNPGDITWEPVEALGDVTVYDRSGELAVERAQGAAIVLTNKDLITAEEMDRLPQLRYIGVLATGTNIVDLRAATDRNIVVTNVPGYGVPSVSQHVFALLLELASHTSAHVQTVRDGQWANCPDFCYTVDTIEELAGKTLGIVGVGAIGSRVARIGHAFGMRVVAAHQPVDPPVNLEAIPIEWMTVDEVFSASDVITLHCPLTDETHHLVNAARLARMKPTAYLINTGRGPLIDEQALLAALREKQLRGAALDVLEIEPPTEGNPLIGAPRCLVTPHIAWASIESRKRLMQIAADSIAAFLEGKPINVVN